jgi:hypothetical protein
MNKVNKFFKIISGRPKDVGFTESIKIIPSILLWGIAIGLMIYGFTINSLIICLMSLVFAWQDGWMMSIERCIKHQEKNS